MSDDLLAISIEYCRARQRRVLELMQKERLDLVIVVRHEHVQYLAGPRIASTLEAAAALDAEGHLTLVVPKKQVDVAAADEIVTYSPSRLSTMRNDQRKESSDALFAALARRKPARRVGVEFSSCGPHITARLPGELVDIEPELYVFRRRKDPDELAKLRRAIDGTGVMYAKAKEIMAPGISELEMFNELQSVCVESFGEMLTGTGNDYACGERGGHPREGRVAADGELYILDLGPAYRGYFADNCRTYAVNRRPTDAQHKAWEAVAESLAIVERRVKPGVRCQEVFQEVLAHLEAFKPGGFNHHLGHGIGLFPHEAPHLNPNWDDTFEVGEVFTAEPGMYYPELRAGIRLENDYLVTEWGIEKLSDFPLGLV